MRWYQYKAEYLKTLEASGSYRTISGLNSNTGKTFFLKTKAQAVREVSMQQDEKYWNYFLKEMICFGMHKQPNGFWKVKQLFPHVQNIVSSYRETLIDWIEKKNLKSLE